MPSAETPATPRRTLAGIACLVIATLAWAGNFLVGGFASAEMGAFDLVWARWAIALVPLVLVAQLFERPHWGEVLRHWPRHLAVGLMGVGAYNLLLYLSLEHGSALNSALINAFNPALIAVAAVVILGSRMSVRAVVGIVIAFLGVVLVLSGGDPLAILREPLQLGSVFMLGAIVVWTGYTIGGRLGAPLPPIASVTVQAAIALMVLAPFAWWDGLTVPAQGAGWAALIYIGLGPSLIAYVFWNLALERLPAQQAGASLNLITVFTVAGSLLLGASANVAEIVGGVMVLAGVLLTVEFARPVRAPR
ncbi:DMT family transporter [Salinibacterium sp. dk2585]|uniref:DMT family transporter n=1 Tax=unclassified Salinibacterium TaxID=2632331 RepID=UPI0011C25204|nr:MULTISPECIES: DMT family transporter [unclassified Salinibacterium]QEE60770.1 DMT family transporter [Salinibacterium sp. dk2585]TXK55842.1 DMT family transporter [Salinibacterium sp. dk5596]